MGLIRLAGRLAHVKGIHQRPPMPWDSLRFSFSKNGVHSSVVPRTTRTLPLSDPRTMDKKLDDSMSKNISGSEVHRTQSQSNGDVENLALYGTHRGLKSRHAQMLALGGTIGTGLFVGTGQALSMGGPIFLLTAYTFITIVLYGIITATTEINSYLPVRGSGIAYYATRFVSDSLGFALGWMYWYIFSITVPAEITAVSLVFEYWNLNVNTAVWISISIAVILALNFFPVKYYGEAEFWFASIKIFGLVVLFFTAIVLICGGGPNHQVLGFHYWTDPGPIKAYLVPGAGGKVAALLATTVYSVYAFAFAPELLVVTGGEMQSPRRNLPKAGRRYFYRLIFFYVVGVFLIGMIVSSNNERLLGGGSGAGSSPWAIAISEAGISILPSIINAIILTSAWSAGNSYLYMASRALYGMALVGNAPKIFTRCSRNGIPYYATAVSGSVSLLAYMNLSNSGSTVFVSLAHDISSFFKDVGCHPMTLCPNTDIPLVELVHQPHQHWRLSELGRHLCPVHPLPQGC